MANYETVNSKQIMVEHPQSTSVQHMQNREHCFPTPAPFEDKLYRDINKLTGYFCVSTLWCLVSRMSTYTSSRHCCHLEMARFRTRLDSHIAWALECPLPQTQLQESRVLNYLKSVTACDTQNEYNGNGQLDLVQQMRDIRKPWPIVERAWLDGREQDIASLSSNVQNLELVADIWKDHYDSLALEHYREEFEMELQERRLVEQLQEERLKSYNCEINVLNLESMIKETLETEACGNIKY